MKAGSILTAPLGVMSSRRYSIVGTEPAPESFGRRMCCRPHLSSSRTGFAAAPVTRLEIAAVSDIVCPRDCGLLCYIPVARSPPALGTQTQRKGSVDLATALEHRFHDVN